MQIQRKSKTQHNLPLSAKFLRMLKFVLPSFKEVSEAKQQAQENQKSQDSQNDSINLEDEVSSSDEDNPKQFDQKIIKIEEQNTKYKEKDNYQPKGRLCKTSKQLKLVEKTEQKKENAKSKQ